MEPINLLNTRSDSDNLPWYTSYELPKSKKPLCLPIVAVFKTNKGLLVCTPEFKYFLWNNSRDLTNVLEALNQYVADEERSYFLLATACGKKINFSKGECTKGSEYRWSEALEGFYLVDKNFNKYTGNNLL